MWFANEPQEKTVEPAAYLGLGWPGRFVRGLNRNDMAADLNGRMAFADRQDCGILPATRSRRKRCVRPVSEQTIPPPPKHQRHSSECVIHFSGWLLHQIYQSAILDCLPSRC